MVVVVIVGHDNGQAADGDTGGRVGHEVLRNLALLCLQNMSLVCYMLVVDCWLAVGGWRNGNLRKAHMARRGGRQAGHASSSAGGRKGRRASSTAGGGRHARGDFVGMGLGHAPEEGAGAPIELGVLVWGWNMLQDEGAGAPIELGVLILGWNMLQEEGTPSGLVWLGGGEEVAKAAHSLGGVSRMLLHLAAPVACDAGGRITQGQEAGITSKASIKENLDRKAYIEKLGWSSLCREA
eukprot:358065-Chlamydomonas_euryale.AAC.9